MKLTCSYFRTHDIPISPYIKHQSPDINHQTSAISGVLAWCSTSCSGHTQLSYQGTSYTSLGNNLLEASVLSSVPFTGLALEKKDLRKMHWSTVTLLLASSVYNAACRSS